MPERVVVIGNGMVGHRFCERLRERDTEGRYQIQVFGEEPRPAYDRVHLSEFFSGKSAGDLALTTAEEYATKGIDLRLGERVEQIDLEKRELYTTLGRYVPYDVLCFATGSVPFVPPIPGATQDGVFVYRTIEDLEAISAWGEQARRAAVIGGGLLGLEAAKAVRDMGLETHVLEAAPRLMPRQVDARGAALLTREIEALGVQVHVDVRTECILGEADQVTGLRFKEGEDLPVEMVVVSAGIRPRDDLARATGLEVAQRGGIVVDDGLATSQPGVYAIGECAVHRGMIYGLVAPGYEMAEALADRLVGGERAFEGGDLSTKLKLMGVDVASFGDPFADESGETNCAVFEDPRRGVYQKLLYSNDGERLVGGILVGDASRFMPLLQQCKSDAPLPDSSEELLFGPRGEAGDEDLDEGVQICSCNDVSVGAIRAAIADEELATVGGIKACTRAGTGCGGCLPQVTKILARELERAGREVTTNVCEHFAFTRQELFEIVKVNRIASYGSLLASHGSGQGCEICRPVVASILATTWNDPILNHQNLQDTNDRFLANIQRGGTYSVIPRIPGGEITPEKLIVLGEVAKRYGLYCKITGGQRVDLLGARVDQLPSIWEELVDAGFESGHAYGKALRTVKSCVGSSWCRYGVQDSVGFAVRVEERYRGLRAPHKLKSAVSGCIRECAEAQGKDFGIIATENGWNLYLAGNGGANPRHADLVASDVDEEMVIKLIDRFLMYYIHTANPLERTARWVERLDGGIEYLKRVIIEDSLGICEQLERDMQALVDSYQCEWREVVENPERRALFRHFATSRDADPTLEFVDERGQRRPADWPDATPAEPGGSESAKQWVHLAKVEDFPKDSGSTVKVGNRQIAVFRFESRGEWYATQAMCPHRKDMVIGRGLLGSQAGEPKVACPLHKKTFSLKNGCGLSDPEYSLETYEVEVREGEVYALLPDDLASGAPVPSHRDTSVSP